MILQIKRIHNNIQFRLNIIIVLLVLSNFFLFIKSIDIITDVVFNFAITTGINI